MDNKLSLLFKYSQHAAVAVEQWTNGLIIAKKQSEH